TMAEHHLEIFATQIVNLLHLLDDSRTGPAGPCPDLSSPGPSLGEARAQMAHRIAGDGGQLGFMALSAAAGRYAAAWHQHGTQLPEMAATLHDLAGNALEMLRHR
ncbi:MAG TPA: hypothetical protein VGL95_06170, partial [Acetobacteraceae bacterium]